MIAFRVTSRARLHPKRSFERALGLCAAAFVLLLSVTGCGVANVAAGTPVGGSGGKAVYTSVTPSSTGTPNSVVAMGNYSFVSVQGTGQIYTYNIASGTPVATGVYATPCADPSGMVTTTIGGANVMAVVCFDTNSLLTLTIRADGTLTALGAVAGLPSPFPGIALDGANVYVPLFGTSLQANGAVARVSLANPASPAVTAMTTLLSAPSGGFTNPGYVTASGGYVYVAAGSESQPQATTSTIQVIDESSMALAGSPLVVDHSPQEIAISQGYAFVTFFDAGELESIDVTNPASLKPVQTLTLNAQSGGCQALPVVVYELYAYVGCYGQAQVVKYNIGDPTNIFAAGVQTGINSPERMFYSADLRYLLTVGSQTGGSLYQVDGGRF